MHPEYDTCAHPGCTCRALRGRSTCGVHAGLQDTPARPLAAWPEDAPHPGWLAPLGPYHLVLAQRDSLHRYLRLRPGYSPPGLAQEFRRLRALSLTAADLAPALAGTNARDEIDAFLDMLSGRILDHAVPQVSV